MRIGKWLVQIDGWSLVFKRIWDEQAVRDWGQQYDGFFNSVVDTQKHAGETCPCGCGWVIGKGFPVMGVKLRGGCRHQFEVPCDLCKGCDNSGFI